MLVLYNQEPGLIYRNSPESLDTLWRHSYRLATYEALTRIIYSVA